MAPKKLSKPKGAFPKVGGVGGVKFTGSSKMDKFQNFLVSTDETTETRKERFENPSRLYAAARKLGISEKAIKKQIDDMAKYQAKYGAGVEKKTSKMDMQDMMRRSKANAAAKKKTTLTKSDALKKATKAKIQRQTVKGVSTNPVRPKPKATSLKATKKKR
jgi:hypothetical protein